jgi:hypothetical protein
MLASAVAVTYCRLICSRQSSYVSPNIPEKKYYTVSAVRKYMTIHFILTSADKHKTQYTIQKLTTICLVGDARSTRIGQNARVHGKDVRHSEECCRRACKFGSKCASSFLLIEISKGIIRQGRCMTTWMRII